jgi:alpha-amylase
MSYRKFISAGLLAMVLSASCKEAKKETALPADAKDEAVAAQKKWFAASNIYEVNLRQYSGRGTFSEFAKSLPRLKDMGVEILWFMPITPIGIEGRKQTPKELGSYYAVRNYNTVNEEFGTMDEWKALVNQAHSMGFKVITDWVANHSSPDNPWMKSHPQFYERDSTGKVISPFDWTDTRKLNYKNRELRDSMITAMKFWLTETGIDGFRCDVAGEVPTDFWKECIDQLKITRPALFMLAEGEKPELHTAGFDVTYTWSVMGAMKDLYTGKIKLAKFDSILTENIKTYPQGAARLFFTSNHDENSWNGTEFEKYGNASKAFAVFSQTMAQSIPLIYSGQELPNRRRLKFFVKDTIQWTGSYAMAPFYKTLLNLRKSNPALASDASYRRLASSSNDAVFAYIREKEGRRAVMVFNLSPIAQKFRITDAVINGEPLNIFMEVNEKISDTHDFSVEPWGCIAYDYK